MDMEHIRAVFITRANAEIDLFLMDAELNGIHSARLNVARRLDKVIEHTRATRAERERLSRTVKSMYDRSLPSADPHEEETKP
jgi:hypothetical protein